MIIREGTFQDTPGIVELARHAHASSDYRDVPISEDHIKQIVRQVVARSMVDRPQHALFVAEGKTGLCGVFLGLVLPLYECLSCTIASNHFWYATAPRAGMKLLEAFVDWAEQRFDWILFRFGLNDAVIEAERLATVMEWRGFRRSGVIVEKEYRAWPQADF